MADEQSPTSILAMYVADRRQRPLYGTPISELSALALDLSAMMSQVVQALEIIASMPELSQSSNREALVSTLTALMKRFESHSEAMAELNRAR